MDSNHIETNNDRSSRHLLQVAKVIQDYKSSTGQLILNGRSLRISDIHSVFTGRFVSASMSEEAKVAVKNSYDFLKLKIADGCCVYGVNTGFGGSADVRHRKIEAVQANGVTHSMIGFGEKFPIPLTKAAMLVRANCIGLGYSGVQSCVLDLLVEVLNRNIIPYSPMRGTVSASGDLTPLVYIAALLKGRPNCFVNDNGVDKDAPVALSEAKLSPVVFHGKDLLGVINAASFAATLGAEVLYRGNVGIVLTQALVALTVEALEGRLESYKPVIHEQCLPHVGQGEVARNLTNFLSGSKFVIAVLEMDRGFREGELKQDRYGLRSSPQWLGPTLETALESMRRVQIELNSANDNPLIDPRTKQILHCANFQGNSSTVAMDQFRQSMQICGKLLFGLMSEIMDYKINNGLSPNVCGGDPNFDMGFKGTEIAMASYTSELDYLTNPLSNHVLSAELRNQAVNSLALISARMSETALEIFEMQIANFLLSLCQAVELRWIKSRVEKVVVELVSSNTSTSMNVIFRLVPWYCFFCSPERAIALLVKDFPESGEAKDPIFVEQLTTKMSQFRDDLIAGKYVNEIANDMGQGTRLLFLLVRDKLATRFYDGEIPQDINLQKIFDALKNGLFDDVVLKLAKLANMSQNASLNGTNGIK